MLGVQSLQPLAGDVRIDGRRRDVGMSEQQLHYAKIRAVIEQVRRESMAQRVRRKLGGSNARLQGIALDQLPERLPGERAAARGDEDRVALRTSRKLGSARREIALEPIHRLFAQRDEALLAALAEDAHDTHVEAHLSELEADEF